MSKLPASGSERAVAGVLVGGAVVFAGLAANRVPAVGFVAALSLPLVLLVADLLIAAAVATRWYPIRPVAQGLAVFGLLVHVLVALRSGPVPIRGCAGVLVVAHGWALVLLFLLTAAEDAAAGPDDELAENDALEPADPPPVFETPVSEVVELDPELVPDPEPRSTAPNGGSILPGPPSGTVDQDEGTAPDEPRSTAVEPHQHEERTR